MKILITAAIAMVAAYGLSRYFKGEFKVFLEYAAIIFLVMGIFSFVGSRGLAKNPSYTNTHEYAKRHRELLSDTASFIIYIILVAAILLVAAWLIW